MDERILTKILICHLQIIKYVSYYSVLWKKKRHNLSPPLHKCKPKAKTKNMLEGDSGNIEKIKQILLI